MALSCLLHRFGLAALALVGGVIACAPVTETRRKSVVDSQPVRLYQRREPRYDSSDVLVHVEGGSVLARLNVRAACAVRYGERKTIREDIERKPDGWAIGAEAALAALGATAAALAIDDIKTNCDVPSRSGCSFSPGVAAVGLTTALVLGTATVIDLVKPRHLQRTKEVVEPARSERVENCSDFALSNHVIAIAFPRATLSAVTDSDGVARILVPDDLWWQSDGVLEVEVRVDWRPVKRAVLRRGP